MQAYWNIRCRLKNELSNFLIKLKRSSSVIDPLSAYPRKRQTHSNNSPAKADK